MVNLTVKELSVLEKQLVLERNMVKKFKFYSTICSDPQLKQNANKFQRCIRRILINY